MQTSLKPSEAFFSFSFVFSQVSFPLSVLCSAEHGCSLTQSVIFAAPSHTFMLNGARQSLDISLFGV